MDNGSNGSVDETTSYTYDANDRLQQELLDTDGLAGAERTTTYTYNNTVQTGKSVTGDVTETHTYDYDAMGRMESSTVVKGGVTTTSTYAYNADGIRVQQVVTVGGNSTTTNYHIDANNHTGYAQVLEEKDASGNVTKTYTLGHDVVAQAEVDPQQTGTNAGTALAFLYDGHGSTRALVTPAGIVLTDGTNGLQLFTYDAYGNLLPVAGQLPGALTTLLYSGEITDATTGLQYLRARYYDPTTGRFTRLDPFAGSVSDPLSLHKYLYTHGNPVMGVDPSGQFALAATLGTISLGALISASLISNVGSTLRESSSTLSVVLPVYEVEVNVAGGTSEPLTVFVIPGLRDRGRLESTAFIGSSLLYDSLIREWYIKEVTSLKPLPPGYDPLRRGITVKARQLSTGIGDSAATLVDKIRGKTLDTKVGSAFGSNTKTNWLVDRIAIRELRPIGTTLIVVGAGMSVYNIFSANDPYRQTAVEAGAWTGALAGGWLGAKTGAWLGSLIPPPPNAIGAAVGAIAGGIAGSIAGGLIVGHAAGLAYDDFSV